MAELLIVPSTDRGQITALRGIEGRRRWAANQLTYAFAKNADFELVAGSMGFMSKKLISGIFNPLDSSNYTENAFKTSIENAFSTYERVSRLEFTVSGVFDTADIKISGVDGLNLAGSQAGYSTEPGSNKQSEFQGQINYDSYLFLNTTSEKLLGSIPSEQGAANALMTTAIHELGHGLGIAHPHDGGNISLIVTSSELQAPNDIALDNERYTVMAYEAGGLDEFTLRKYGHAAGLSALDIAAIQAMYGTNPTTNAGNTTYTLLDQGTGALDVEGNDGNVQIGRAFFSIWDTGGTDTIAYNGNDRVLLNLNDATLSLTDDAVTQAWITDIQTATTYAALPQEFKDDLRLPDYHAGGFFSRIFRSNNDFDLGGYSIAHGVQIENATGSSKNDFLIGNEFDNRLEGNDGADFLHGSSGDDTLLGGAGNDELFGGDGDDIFRGSAGNDKLYGGNGDDIAIYSGYRSEYIISRNSSNNSITVKHQNGGRDGEDILQNIETLRFREEVVDADSDDFAAHICGTGSGYGSDPDHVACDLILSDFEDDLDRLENELAADTGSPIFTGSANLSYLIGSASLVQISNSEYYPGYRFIAVSFFLNSGSGGSGGGSFSIVLPGSFYYKLFTTTLLLADTNSTSTQGSSTAETILGTNTSDTLNGGGGNDIILGVLDNDYLRGEDGDDSLYSDDGDDTLEGGDGNDTLYGGAGADQLYSGAGNDLSFGGDGNDTLYGGLSDGNDTLYGERGDDILDGGAGNDEIYGGEGNDYVAAGDGIDQVYGDEGNDELYGGTGDDLVSGGIGDDLVHGGVGEFRDTLYGDAGDDQVYGDAGDDMLYGGDGNDILYGGAGNDVLFAEEGNDTLYGGIENGADTLYGGAGNDYMDGNAGDDILYGDAGDDMLYGDAGNDMLYGGVGNDGLYGGEGNDVLLGEEGDDILYGGIGAGNDTLSGGAGSNLLEGGDGDDVFVVMLGGFSQVSDFQVGSDRLGLLNGMTFADLTITQGVDTTPYAVISIGSEVVAHVLNVAPGAIIASSVGGA